MAEETATTTDAGATGTDDTGSATDTGQQNTGQTTGQQNADTGVPPEMKRALAKANKEAETLRLKLKEFEDRDKTAAQLLEERATAAEKAASDAASQLMRFQVAATKGLPAELATRLQGSTEKELSADADSLLELLAAKGTGTTPAFNGGARKAADAPTSMNDLIRSRTGRG